MMAIYKIKSLQSLQATANVDSKGSVAQPRPPQKAKLTYCSPSTVLP
jgi:hypothetical protein